jgi:hypothetical protein
MVYINGVLVKMILDKIHLEEISYHVEGTKIIFSCQLKKEKELLFAAGRIHRETTHGTGVWELKGSTLSFTIPTSILDKSLEKIKQSFNMMVS